MTKIRDHVTGGTKAPRLDRLEATLESVVQPRQVGLAHIVIPLRQAKIDLPFWQSWRCIAGDATVLDANADRLHLRRVLDERPDGTKEGTVYRITRGGRGSMVLVDEEYFNGWMAALDEMRRPDWRESHDQPSRDIAAGRGRNLDTVAKELGLEGRSHAGRRESARRIARPRRKKGQLESTYNEAEHPATIPAPPHTAAPCPRR